MVKICISAADISVNLIIGIPLVKFVSRHEKTGLMYTKYTYSYYSMYLHYCIRFTKSVNCITFSMRSCINGENCTRLPYVYMKLFNFEFQNVVKFYMHISYIFSCQVTFYEHVSPWSFLMPGHMSQSLYKDCTCLVESWMNCRFEWITTTRTFHTSSIVLVNAGLYV